MYVLVCIQGNTNRITTSTSMNNMSSRSHAIFTIVLETEGVFLFLTFTSTHPYIYILLLYEMIDQIGIKDEKLLYTVGKINLVDLAGSERMYKMVW